MADEIKEAIEKNLDKPDIPNRVFFGANERRTDQN